MSRTIGTVSRGVRAPIIRNGDDIVRFILNYNSFDVVVKLSETVTYELSAYGCVRID